MKYRYKSKPKEQVEIAKERIQILFKEAKKAKDQKLSNRYVQIARKIGMKYKVRIPANLQRSFCKHCYSYLRPGKNCRIRTSRGKVVYYCLNCKKYMRFNY